MEDENFPQDLGEALNLVAAMEAALELALHPEKASWAMMYPPFLAPTGRMCQNPECNGCGTRELAWIGDTSTN